MKKIIKKIYRKLPLPEKFRYKIHDFLKKEKKDKSLITKTEFLKIINKYDVISFDIFDTLISRMIYAPDDVFIIMSEQLGDSEFLTKRKNAESEARKKLNKDVNIDEIYEAYAEIYNVNTEKYRELEIKLELELCIPRKDMLDVFNEIKGKKEIILTSDMYLTKDVITEMLTKCGYTAYDKFYLSNDINKRKDTKEIWPYLKNLYSNKKIIHIGDNYQSDFMYPREFGISSLKINSPRELFSKVDMFNYVQEFIDNKNISNSILLGLLINKTIFNSPFSNLKIDNIDDFGYSFYAPIITSFLKYICDNTKDNTLLFLAREGFYLQKLYDYYCEQNGIVPSKNVYFLASRKATITAGISKKEDLSKVLDNDFNGTIKDYFKQLLDFDYEGDNFNIELPKQKEEILPIIEKYSDDIIEKCKQEKINYLKYINNEVGNLNTQKVSIIDLGYSGTIQYQLSKLTDYNFDGYYLTNSSNVKHYFKDSKLDFLFDINDNQEYKKIYSYSLILEYFLSAPFGQLIRFDEKADEIVPVYNDETIDETKQVTIDKLYDSVVSYINTVDDINKIYKYNPDLELICRLYVCLIEGNLVSRKVKDKFDFMDAFCSNEKKNAFKIISRY